MAYGQNIPPTGSSIPHRPMPGVFFPRTHAHDMPIMKNDNHEGMAESIREQIARTLREFGFSPKGHARAYLILGGLGCRISVGS
jgi:hypothetical protein